MQGDASASRGDPAPNVFVQLSLNNWYIKDNKIVYWYQHGTRNVYALKLKCMGAFQTLWNAIKCWWLFSTPQCNHVYWLFSTFLNVIMCNCIGLVFFLSFMEIVNA